MSRRIVSLCLILLLSAFAGTAQTLAHPGWRGNGIVAEQWWRHAAVIELPKHVTFAQATAALDTVSAAGADTLLLPDLQPDPNGSAPFAQRLGGMDELDAFLREASARRMHVLLTAPLLRLASSSGELRFWLARGIAGFRVGTLRPADVDTLHVLRVAVDRYPGQRLLLTSLDQVADPGFAQRFAREFHAPTLRLVDAAEAAALPAGTMAAITIPEPLTTPTLHGLLPILPLPVVQTDAGASAARQLLAHSRPVPTRATARGNARRLQPVR